MEVNSTTFAIYSSAFLVASVFGVLPSMSHATALYDSRGTSATCAGIGPIVSDCIKMAEQSGLIQTKNLGFTGITFGTSGDSDGVIVKIEPGSSAAQAGLQVGDAITAVNGKPVQQTPGTIAEERTFGARGDKLQLKVQRGSSELSFTFAQAAKDAPPDPKSISKLIYVRAIINWKGQFIPCMGAGPAGLAAIAICQSTFKKDGYIKTSDFGSPGFQLDLTRTDGAQIAAVDAGSPAATAGLQPGDVDPASQWAAAVADSRRKSPRHALRENRRSVPVNGEERSSHQVGAVGARCKIEVEALRPWIRVTWIRIWIRTSTRSHTRAWNSETCQLALSECEEAICATRQMNRITPAELFSRGCLQTGNFRSCRQLNASQPLGRDSRLRRGSHSLRHLVDRTRESRSQTSRPTSLRAPRGTFALSPNVRTASCKNAAFFPCDSARVTTISGRQSAIGIPGKPAPEPKSSRVAMPAGSALAQAIDSAKWMEIMPSSALTEVRLSRAFQRRISER